MKSIHKMTIEEKAGQLYVVGFNGTQMNDFLRELIVDWKIGGLVFSIRNVENPIQVSELIQEMQELALKENNIPLIITINQEGGDRTCFLESLSRNPGSMAIGATLKPSWAYKIAKIVGSELRALGFNMLYMPVLDLAGFADNSVLGIRSFGSEPQFVAGMGEEFINGLNAAGIASTAKHFPGVGGSSVDAHFDLPTIPRTMDELDQYDLVPFKKAIKANVSAMMTSHVRYSDIDGDAIGTFSEVINTNIAREKLGFKGVITTDAFGMKGLTNYFSPTESAVKAIVAGADIVLKRHGREANFANLKSLRNALQNGQISDERIHISLKRIFDLKEKYCVPVKPNISTTLWNKDHIRELEMMGEESVTLARNWEKILPLKLDYKIRVLLIMPNMLANASLDGITGDSAGYIIRGILSDKYSYSTDGFDLVHFNLNPFSKEIKMVVEQAQLYDLLILGSHRSNMNPQQAEMIKQIFKLNKKIIWIALNTPYDLLNYPDASTYICTYGDRLPQLKGLCRLIAGEIVPKGKLPVPIQNLYSFGHGISSWNQQ